jgi:hypothetical protein
MVRTSSHVCSMVVQSSQVRWGFLLLPAMAVVAKRAMRSRMIVMMRMLKLALEKCGCGCVVGVARGVW